MTAFVEPKRSMIMLQNRRRLRFRMHSQSEAEFFYLLRGWTDVTVEGECYRFRAGDLGVIFPYQIHEYLQDSPDLQAILLIATEEQLMGREQGLFLRPPVSPVLRGLSEEHPAVSALCRACVENQKNLPYREELIGGHLTVFTAELMRCLELSDHAVIHDDAAHRILEYCNEHYREPLTLDTLSDALFISRSHLSHVFSGKLGTSFCRYLGSVRVEAACRALRDPDCPSVTELAEQMGFGSVRNFNRAFHRYRGISPAQYRRDHLKPQKTAEPLGSAELFDLTQNPGDCWEPCPAASTENTGNDCCPCGECDPCCPC